MIPGAGYFDKIVEPVLSTLTVSEKRLARKQWHQEALAVCDGYDLVFLDPDNGLRAGTPTAKKDTVKFVYSSEAADYYERGQDVVYYCHKGRRKPEAWEQAKTEIRKRIRDAQILGVTFHRGTQRSYIFVVHPDQYRKYVLLLNKFGKTAWIRMFEREPIQGNVINRAERVEHAECHFLHVSTCSTRLTKQP